MKHRNRPPFMAILFVTLFMSLCSLASARETGNAESPSHNKADQVNEAGRVSDPLNQKHSPSGKAIVYNPPLRGAPLGRVGGGTRGNKDALSTLFALAPDHVGLTSSEQPSLYWFLAEEVSFPIELTITEYKATLPLLETRIAPPVKPGLHRIRLAEYGLRLSPNVLYQWFISIIPDPQHRSKDVIAGGAIERVTLSEALQKRIREEEKTEISRIYAEAGLWYDAFSAVSDLIAVSPDGSGYREMHDSLLKQVGLPELTVLEAETRGVRGYSPEK